MAFHYRITWRAAFAVGVGMAGGFAIAALYSPHGLTWFLGTLAGYSIGFAVAFSAGWVPRRW